jgi:hypothetical protein
MSYWKQLKEEQLRIDNAWVEELSPFLKIMDSNIGFALLCCFLPPIAFGIGFLFGLIW